MPTRKRSSSRSSGNSSDASGASSASSRNQRKNAGADSNASTVPKQARMSTSSVDNASTSSRTDSNAGASSLPGPSGNKGTIQKAGKLPTIDMPEITLEFSLFNPKCKKPSCLQWTSVTTEKSIPIKNDNTQEHPVVITENNYKGHNDVWIYLICTNDQCIAAGSCRHYEFKQIALKQQWPDNTIVVTSYKEKYSMVYIRCHNMEPNQVKPHSFYVNITQDMPNFNIDVGNASATNFEVLTARSD